MPLDDLLYDRESRAGPAHFPSYRTLKQLKDPLGMFRRDPDPAISNDDARSSLARTTGWVGCHLNVRSLPVPVKFQGV